MQEPWAFHIVLNNLFWCHATEMNICSGCRSPKLTLHQPRDYPLSPAMNKEEMGKVKCKRECTKRIRKKKKILDFLQSIKALIILALRAATSNRRSEEPINRRSLRLHRTLKRVHRTASNIEMSTSNRMEIALKRGPHLFFTPGATERMFHSQNDANSHYMLLYGNILRVHGHQRGPVRAH